MKRHGLIVVCGLALALGAASCRKQVQVKGVELAVDFSDKTLTDNLVTNVTYKWKTTSAFRRVSRALPMSAERRASTTRSMRQRQPVFIAIDSMA